MNYYSVLELPRDASLADIRKSYRRLSLAVHPDKNPSADPNEFFRVNEAYQVLADPAKRAMYDREGQVDQTALKNAEEVFRQFFDSLAESGFFGTPELHLGVSVMSHVPHPPILLNTLFGSILHPDRSGRAGHSPHPKSTPLSTSKSPDVHLTLRVSLEDAYLDRLKRLVVKRTRVRGDAYVSEDTPFIVPCSQRRVVFRHQADQLPDCLDTGDLVVDIIVQIYNKPSHTSWRMCEGQGLGVKVPVSIAEVYGGCSKIIAMPDGEALHVTLARGAFGDLNFRLPDRGLFSYDAYGKRSRRGDLSVDFVVSDVYDPAKSEELNRIFPSLGVEDMASTRP